ncbi:MAG TPA: Do family serine endopeptidase [Steroidobacteraceae bacterium]|nr:Do family serine endopeptidase [Steroidobacteraceae bacterium]
MELKKTTLALSASGLLAVGAAAGWVGPGLLNASSAAAAETVPATAAHAVPSTAPEPIPLRSAPNYRAIVAANRAAVVTITSRSMERESSDSDDNGDGNDNGNGFFGGNSPFGNDPFFQFFRELPIPRPQPVESLGSGFIVQSNGVILTNAHVVRNATHVTVKLADNREYRAKVVGLDKSTDVAVLKIDAKDLPTVRLGNSNQLEVGDYVLALGAPYGLQESATAGIVSAISRELPDNPSPVPFIQTDVAVNPGNSGGPLFDEHGTVVGINSQIYSNTGGFEGVSFAIPIDVAVHDELQILKTGKVEHAKLGVEVQAVTQALARSFNLNAPQGALVAQVEPNSAAERAGVKSGDVILQLDGKPVSDSGSLAAQVSMLAPGTKVKLEIWRSGRTLTLEATLGNAAAGPVELQANNGGNLHGKLGLAVRPLTPDERQQAGVPAGLLVERSTGPAADAGIQPGDIVLSADGTPLNSIDALRKVVANHKDAIALLVQRNSPNGSERIFVPVQLG